MSTLKNLSVISVMVTAVFLGKGCSTDTDDDISSPADDSSSTTVDDGTSDEETSTEVDKHSETDTGLGTDSGTASDSDVDTADLDTVSDAEAEFTERVVIETNMGDIVVGLLGQEAPITVENFLTYVDEGYFTDLIFHRVIPDFMIQGGGLDAKMEDKETHPPIPLEIADEIKHEPGVISMARTIVEDSATSQFFICVETLPSLDGEYAAFGRVIEGYDIVEAISLVETHTVGAYEDVPVDPVVIKSISRLEDKKRP